MSRYDKYFLNSSLRLEDDFCVYYLQDDIWGRQEILDVESLVFVWEEEIEQWLIQCAEFDHYNTMDQLRSFLVENYPGRYLVFRMNDKQVIRAVADQICMESQQLVIEPRYGWSLEVDEQTASPTVPIAVEPPPDLDNLVAELRTELDALVVEQQKRYQQHEAALAGKSSAEVSLYYSQNAGGQLYDTAIGDTLDTVGSAVKAFPGFYKGYLKLLWKIAQTPARMAQLSAQALATGDVNPLKEEIDKIIDPVTHTYDQAMQYKCMLTVLFHDPVTYNLLHDFAHRYWDATHPVDRMRMGVSAATDIVVTIVLAIVTAGIGAAANAAAKSGRLVKVAKLLEKVTAVLKKMGPGTKLPRRAKEAAGKSSKIARRTDRAKRHMGRPKAVEKLDNKVKNGYDGGNKKHGPKTTDVNKAKSPKEPIRWDQEEQSFIDADGKKFKSSEMPEGFGKPSTWKEGQRDVTEEMIAARNGAEMAEKMKNSAEADDLASAIEAFVKGIKK